MHITFVIEKHNPSNTQFWFPMLGCSHTQIQFKDLWTCVCEKAYQLCSSILQPSGTQCWGMEVFLPSSLFGIFGSAWRHCGLSQFGERCYWNLVGRVPGYGQTHYMQRIMLPPKYCPIRNVNNTKVDKLCLKMFKNYINSKLPREVY